MSSSKPKIGVTPCTKPDDYVESIRRAGGEPEILSNDDDPGSVIERVDGILLTGGPDVDPALYGQGAHPETKTDLERDRFEVPLAKAALERDLPLLGICRGVQVLNVAAGGTLTQDIPSQLQTAINHAITTPKDHPAHTVTVTADSRLASALGSAARSDRCSVNSRHHQALGEVAREFVVCALSPDHIVEAIERPASTFCVGVQWHPENFVAGGEFAGLFNAFVAAARHRRQTALKPGSD